MYLSPMESMMRQQQGGYGGGWPQMGGYGMGGGYQPQAPSGAQQGDARIDKLRGRVSNLQEQMKGAGTEQMAGMQARMDQMQGRIKNLRQDRRQGEGLYAQPQGQQGGYAMYPTGGGDAAGRAYFGDMNAQAGPWAAQMQAMANRQPWGGMQGGGGQMGGASPWGGGFGMNQMRGGMFGENMRPGGGIGAYDQFGNSMGGGMGMAGFGGWGGQQFGYNPGANFRPSDPSQINLMGQQQGLAAPQGPTGANRPGMQYRQDRRQAQRQGGPGQGQMPQQGGAPQSYYEAGTFDTPFGNLVQSSVGNGNIYKRNGTDGQDLYHYDPTVGWKHMTQQEYMGYNNPADFYQDPNQYAAQAGGVKNEYEMRDGMWRTKLGTGTYR